MFVRVHVPEYMHTSKALDRHLLVCFFNFIHEDFDLQRKNLGMLSALLKDDASNLICSEHRYVQISCVKDIFLQACSIGLQVLYLNISEYSIEQPNVMLKLKSCCHCFPNEYVFYTGFCEISDNTAMSIFTVIILRNQTLLEF